MCLFWCLPVPRTLLLLGEFIFLFSSVKKLKGDKTPLRNVLSVAISSVVSSVCMSGCYPKAYVSYDGPE